ncbi:hypothetical protein [Pseudonocardia abyssalis]|uniref:Tail tube protein n=1 Tax=Pseudonocardia abyssalis TaxID=2792008 RepID=A0ABS6UY94_9PSEU|nr:hypothetical protein [Pseudonocardia abyssalis]MBW0117026.1 hypothetical protein [Pseudonocardia abyssalis]MBW0136858.1 hypothetical protein [Pseudonocardia abyssalis]
MAFVHGKNTFVSLDGDDLSAFTNNVAFNRSADSHDVTTFGKNSKNFQSGLKDGTATIQGVYDSTATGPGAIIRPLIGGLAVEFIYKPEGSGAGKPVSTVDAIVTGYEETAPVADMVTWSCSLQFSDDIVDSVGV